MKYLKWILFFVIIIFLYLYIFKEGGLVININNNDNSNTEIHRIIESDSDIAKEFSAGMNISNYKKLLDRKTILLTKDNNSYENIYYNFENYLNYEEIEDLINDFNKSDVVTTEIIGTSVDNRDIYSLEIGSGNKNILITANIHAAEVASTYFLIKYISNLLNLYNENNEEVINLFKTVKIIIIPSVNPDGYVSCLFGAKNINNKNLYITKNLETIDFEYYKANANGVDINRNFPSQHAGLYYSYNELSETVSKKPSTGDKDFYPGIELGSEPETKALIYWFNKHYTNTYAYIDMHSAGRVVYSGKPNLSDEYNKKSLNLAKIVENINHYKALDKEDEDVGIGNDGTSTDYLSELASGFKFSEETKRLSASSYINPQVKDSSLGIITLETLEVYTFNLNKIKNEYYNKKISKVLDSLINTYTD